MYDIEQTIHEIIQKMNSLDEEIAKLWDALRKSPEPPERRPSTRQRQPAKARKPRILGVVAGDDEVYDIFGRL